MHLSRRNTAALGVVLAVLMAALFWSPSTMDRAEAQSSSTMILKIDYSKSLPQMIDAGDYDTIERGITDSHFPVKRGRSRVKAVLVTMAGVTTSQVRRELHRRKLRPATMPELLAYGDQHLKDQPNYTVFALGSVWRSSSKGVGYVGRMFEDQYGRYLGLEQVYPGKTWPHIPGATDRFLAVHFRK